MMLLAALLASAATMYAFLRPVDRCRMERETQGFNNIAAIDPSCKIDVILSQKRFTFPAWLAHLAGQWEPDANAYGDYLSFSISGIDFVQPSRGAHPDEPAKVVELIIKSSSHAPGTPGYDNPRFAVREGASARADLIATATFPIDPNPAFDKFGLVALKASLAGDYYAGRSVDGYAVYFDCTADGTVMSPLCKRTYTRDGVNVYYHFSKKYLSSWQTFEHGVDQFLAEHRSSDRLQ